MSQLSILIYLVLGIYTHIISVLRQTIYKIFTKFKNCAGNIKKCFYT